MSWKEVNIMKRTLSKVKNLEKFIEKHGDDPFISQSISKMLDYKIKNYEAEIKKLDKELKMFEHTYPDSCSFLPPTNNIYTGVRFNPPIYVA